MMNNNQPIAVSNNSLDHEYFQPVVYANNHVVQKINEKEMGFSSDEDNPENNVNIDISETYKIVPGIQHRTRVYVDNLGFKYYKRETRGNRIYLVCERQKNRVKFCCCTASVSTDEKDNRIILRRRHDHKPSVIDLNLPFLREAIGEKGIDPTITTTLPKTLYDNEIMNYQVAPSNYTFTQARARVKKMRLLRLPRKSRKNNPIVQNRVEEEIVVSSNKDLIKENVAVVEPKKFTMISRIRPWKPLNPQKKNPIVHKRNEKEIGFLSDEDDPEKNVTIDISETYKLIPGIQHHTRVYEDNLGFKYLAYERQNNLGKFCCSTASVSTDEKDNRIILRRPHDHESRVNDLNVPSLRGAISEDEIDSTICTRNLYTDESVNHQETVSNYTCVQAQTRIKRMRRLRQKPQMFHFPKHETLA